MQVLSTHCEVAWFQEKHVYDPITSKYFTNPVGSLCNIGGISFECFADGKPETRPDAILAKI